MTESTFHSETTPTNSYLSSGIATEVLECLWDTFHLMVSRIKEHLQHILGVRRSQVNPNSL